MGKGANNIATIWSKAPQNVLDIVKRLIDLYHEPLKDARIGVIMRSEAPRIGGRIVYGKAEKVSAKAQVHVNYDFVIWLSLDEYMKLAPFQREALIDHELTHCQWDMDTGASLRPHDVEEFAEILERYGWWWPHAEGVAAVAQQARLFEEGRGAVIAIDASFAEQFLRSAAEVLPPDTRIEIGTRMGLLDDDHRPTGETIDDVLMDGDEGEDGEASE